MTIESKYRENRKSGKAPLPFAYEVDQVRIAESEIPLNSNIPFEWVHVDIVVLSIVKGEVPSRSINLSLSEALEGARASLRFTKLEATPFATALGVFSALPVAQLGLHRTDLKFPIIVYRLPTNVLRSEKASDTHRFVVLDGIKRVLVGHAYQIKDIQAIEIDYYDMLRVSREKRIDFIKSFAHYRKLDDLEIKKLRKTDIAALLAKEVVEIRKKAGQLQHPLNDQRSDTEKPFSLKNVYRSVVAVSTDSRIEDGADPGPKIGPPLLSATTNFLEETIVGILIARDRLLNYQQDDLVARLKAQLKIVDFSPQKITRYARRVSALINDLDARPVNIEKLLIGKSGKAAITKRLNSIAVSIYIFRLRHIQWERTGHAIQSNLVRTARGRERFRTDNMGFLHFGSSALTLTADQAFDIAIWTGLNTARICVEHRMLFSVLGCAAKFHDELFNEAQEPTIYMVHQWAAYRVRRRYSDNHFTKIWRKLDCLMQMTGSPLRSELQDQADRL